MDYTMFYILGGVLFAVGLIYLVAYLRKNGYIKKEDLQVVSQILGLNIAILSELKLKNEKDIKLIANTIKNALDQVIKLYEVIDPDKIRKETYEYVVKELDSFGIELTDERKMIIEQLINLSIQMKKLEELSRKTQ